MQGEAVAIGPIVVRRALRMVLGNEQLNDREAMYRPRRLRVLQVIDSLAVGGAEQLLVTLARHIDRDRYHVRVCSMASLDPASPILRDLREEGVPVDTLGGVLWREPRHAVRLAALVRRHKIDVLHAHLSTSTVVGALAGAVAHRPVVATLHNVRDVYTRHGRLKAAIQGQVLRRGVRTVIACAPEVRAMATDELGLPPRKVVDVPNGIDTDAFARADPALVAERRAELLGGAAGPLVMAVGNLLPSKGHVHLIEAARLLATCFPGLRVAIVGRPEEAEPMVRAAIAENGLEGRVTLLGQRRDVAALLAAADLFTLPSLWEGLPLALLEAMAAGRPVVATAVGGVPYVLKDGETGRLVAPGDVPGLAAAMGDLLDDPAEARRLALAGQAHVRAVYGAPAWVRRLEKIYARTANQTIDSNREPGNVSAVGNVECRGRTSEWLG
jgi:glycosyltransferase involved in cell wall biosynthesis